MICKIGHMQTSQLPTTLTAMDLFKLALVCNKYDCVGVVRAWAMIWIAALLETPAAQDFEKLFLYRILYINIHVVILSCNNKDSHKLFTFLFFRFSHRDRERERKKKEIFYMDSPEQKKVVKGKQSDSQPPKSNGFSTFLNMNVPPLGSVQ